MEFLNNYTKENNLELKLNNIKPKYICLKCKSILCEPRVTKCKCSFCESCIRSYVATGAVQCPNCAMDINPETDIYPHVMLEDKIPDLKLECPTGRCGELVAIRNMEKHLRECTHIGVHCPLQRFGCASMLDNEGVNAHLTGELKRHFDLVAQQIDEKATLIDIIQNSNSEHSNKIEEGNKALEGAKVELENLKEENQSMTDKLANIQAEFDTFKCDVTRDINKLTQNLSDKTNKLEMYESNNKLLNQQLQNLKEKAKGCGPSKSVKSRSSSITSQDFAFTFTNLTKKTKKTPHYSDVYTPKDYLFRIKMIIQPNGYVNFFAMSLSNQKADQLKWPIPFKMRLKLMNTDGIIVNQTDFSYANASFHEDFENPGNNDITLSNSCLKVILSDLGNECSVIFTIL